MLQISGLFCTSANEEYRSIFHSLSAVDASAYNVCIVSALLTLCGMLGSYVFVVCCIFSKSNFLKNSFSITIRVSNSLDPDQTRLLVGPDQGPNCLQSSSADDTSRQRVKMADNISLGNHDR